MWLLSTSRAELRRFIGPEDPEIENQGGYAILSHVWSTLEQDFEDIKRIEAKCASRKPKTSKRLPIFPSLSTNPRDYVSEKIRQSCIIAERYGYKWIWNDTCCTDKRSSSELSEAINSMYRYYSSAGVCFAYLADVETLPSRDPMDPGTAAFRDSRWHKRGWTLQELIAPLTLVFLSKSWTSLGMKSDLVLLLENAIGIPASVLTHEPQAMTQLTAAQRLSWMANRTTTRVEDRAYCLLGIFGINMTALYGEGDRAFLRLQEKIMKTSVDISIFAWGAQMDWNALCESEIHPLHDHDNPHHYLLSASLGVFQRLGRLRSSSPAGLLLGEQEAPSMFHPTGTQFVQREPLLHDLSPTFTMTQHGLRCQIPIFYTPSFAVVTLFCFDELQGSHLGLILTPCPQRSSPPLYHTGWTPPNGLPTRVVLLGGSLETLQFNGRTAVFDWKEIYIAPRPPPEAFAVPKRLLDPGPLFGGFRLPHLMFAALTERGWARVPNTKIPYGWTVPHTFDLLFDRAGPMDSHLIFGMGRCPKPSEGSRPHWASFWLVPKVLRLPDDHTPPSHRCPDDHVSEWHNMRMLFTERYLGYAFPFAVAFSPCTITPDSALVLSVAEGKPGNGQFGQSWFRGA